MKINVFNKNNREFNVQYISLALLIKKYYQKLLYYYSGSSHLPKVIRSLTFTERSSVINGH